MNPIETYWANFKAKVKSIIHNFQTLQQAVIMNKEKIGYIRAYNIHDFAQGSVLALNKMIGSVCGVYLVKVCSESIYYIL